MMDIEIIAAVRSKLWHKHGVTVPEILECFANRRRGALIDLRSLETEREKLGVHSADAKPVARVADSQ
jgi:hypothetical protein